MIKLVCIVVFKIIGNAKEWEDLYLSKHSSEQLALFRPEIGRQQIHSDGFTVSILYQLIKENPDRPKQILLIVERNPGVHHAFFHEFLLQHCGSALKEYLESGGDADSVESVNSIKSECLRLDELLFEESEARSPGRKPTFNLPLIGAVSGIVALMMGVWMLLERKRAARELSSTIQPIAASVENNSVKMAAVLAKVSQLEREVESTVKKGDVPTSSVFLALSKKTDRLNEEIRNLTGDLKTFAKDEDVLTQASELATLLKRVQVLEKDVATLKSEFEEVEKE